LPVALGAEVGEADFSYYPNYSIMSGMFADEARDLEVLKHGARRAIELADGQKPDDRIVSLLVKSW
jgi:hypothetical protein